MKEEINQAMAERFAWIRKDQKLSLKKMGDVLGYSDSAITLMENGKRPILERVMQALTERMHVNRKWFETGEGEPYADDDATILTGQLAEAYAEGGVFKAFADVYLSMTDAQKATINEMIDRFHAAYEDAKANGTEELDLMDVSLQTAALMDGLTETDEEA